MSDMTWYPGCATGRLLSASHQHTIAYDILVFGEGENYDEAEKDHERLTHKIKVNQEKLVFKVQEVKFVGHIISKDGMKPDPSKVLAMTQMPQPCDKSRLHRLMGRWNICHPSVRIRVAFSGPCWHKMEFLLYGRPLKKKHLLRQSVWSPPHLSWCTMICQYL